MEQMKKRKWTTYADEDKASAVLLLEVAGYPHNQYALNRVSKEIGVPLSTLRTWANKTHGAPPAKVYERKKGELSEKLRDVAHILVDRINEIADTGDLKETATALGIVIDKLQLLDGGATSNTNQRIVIEYADDADIVTEAVDVAERHYQTVKAI